MAQRHLIFAHLVGSFVTLTRFEVGLPEKKSKMTNAIHHDGLRPGLPIQLCGLNITKAIWVARCQEHDIGCDELVIFHSDDVTNLHTVPLFFHQLTLSKNARFSVVDLSVGLMTLLKEENYEIITY